MEPTLSQTLITKRRTSTKGAPLMEQILYGKEVVGRRIKLCNTKAPQRTWEQAKVIDHDQNSGQHQLRFSDASVGWVGLTVLKFRWLGEPPQNAEPNPTFISSPKQEAAVGRRVRVWWPGMGKWYMGLVKSYDAPQDKHRIDYKDGDFGIVSLRHEAVMWLDDAGNSLGCSGPPAAAVAALPSAAVTAITNNQRSQTTSDCDSAHSKKASASAARNQQLSQELSAMASAMAYATAAVAAAAAASSGAAQQHSTISSAAAPTLMPLSICHHTAVRNVSNGEAPSNASCDTVSLPRPASRMVSLQAVTAHTTPPVSASSCLIGLPALSAPLVNGLRPRLGMSASAPISQAMQSTPQQQLYQQPQQQHTDRSSVDQPVGLVNVLTSTVVSELCELKGSYEELLPCRSEVLIAVQQGSVLAANSALQNSVSIR